MTIFTTKNHSTFLLAAAIFFCFISFPFFANAQTNDPFVVVLDAGHGGQDPGAKGSFSLEKNVALAITLKLGQILNTTQPDVKVIYTRTTDVYPALYARAALANKNNADLFISIHCNSTRVRRVRRVVGHHYVKRHGKRVRVPTYRTHYYHETKARGTETIVLGLHRNGEKEKAIEDNYEADDEAAESGGDSSDIATRENSYIVNEKNYKQNYQGFDPDKPETAILLALRSSAFLTQSIAFADSIEHQFVKAGRPSREVVQMGLAVLAGSAMPAVLVETGFINNPDDERYLNSDLGQKQIANCIAKAIANYKKAVRGYEALRSMNDNKEVIAKGSSTGDVPVVYKIQLLVSENKYTPNASVFKNIDGKINMETINVNNNTAYRYLTGKYSSENEADNKLEKIKLIGFKDAFIVPYQNGERLDD